MFREASLVRLLKSLDFIKLRRGVFKLESCHAQIDHFLYFIVRPEKSLVSADFGFRNSATEEFSVNAFLRCTAFEFPMREMLDQLNCSMRFSFWRFVSMRGPCCWPMEDSTKLIASISSDLSTHLLPFLHSMRTSDDMFERLVSDTEPCPWFATNAAIRIAQVIYLGRRLRKPLSQLEDIAATRSLSIRRDLGVDSADSFVDMVFRDAVLH